MSQETLKSQAGAFYYVLWEGNTDAAKILVENGAKVSVTCEMLRKCMKSSILSDN